MYDLQHQHIVRRLNAKDRAYAAADEMERICRPIVLALGFVAIVMFI